MTDDQALHLLRGALDEGRAALDDASGVLDASQDEAYAYEHVLTDAATFSAALAGQPATPDLLRQGRDILGELHEALDDASGAVDPGEPGEEPYAYAATLRVLNSARRDLDTHLQGTPT